VEGAIGSLHAMKGASFDFLLLFVTGALLALDRELVAPTNDTSISLSLTPGSSAVSVTVFSSSATSMRGASTPPMLRPNQSSNSESTWLLNVSLRRAPPCRGSAHDRVCRVL
jgi:hypothetical protein